MLRAQDLVAKADHCDELADRVTDILLASSLRRRAREWRDIAAEVRVLEQDPMYRSIHDGPNHDNR